MDATQRLERTPPDRLDARQRALYDSIVGGPRASGPQHFRLVDSAGGLEGPFNAFLLQPEVGECLQRLGAAIRFGTSLDDRERELAILVVAAEWNSGFEQHAHEAIGRAAGLTDEELEAIRAGADADTAEHWPNPRELSLVRLTRRLAHNGNLDDRQYAAAVETFGATVLFELTTLVGYYATLALQLRVFGVSPPNDGADPSQITY